MTRAAAAVERVAAAGAIAAALMALAIHAREALGGGYLTYVSGIWWTLARDLRDGLFYRDLIGEAGYGGTRYFPLFFAIMALFMRAGASAVAAGWLAGAVSAIALSTGMLRLVRALGGGRLTAGLFAAGVLAPYFVQQTLFEVRADVLAAALNVWGLAFLLPAWSRATGSRVRPGMSALGFTLALSAKITSLAVPGAALAAAFLAGQRRLALSVLWRLAIGAAVFLAVVHWASAGRAIASWRACMFAGTDAGGTLASVLTGDFLQIVRYSRLLIALCLVALASLAAALVHSARRPDPGSDRRSLVVPAGLFLGASMSTAMALSSPGTVASNQMVEWIAIVFVVLAFLACTRPTLARPLVVVAALLVLWSSAQDFVRARQLRASGPGPLASADVDALVARVASSPAPVLSESPLWPVLAERPVYLLDPFALRVVTESRPDIEQDLAAKLDRQLFPLVILQVDPASRAGQGYYEHVNFGRRLTAKILERYRFESRPRSDAFVYVPKAAAGR